jgi:hypothetical protein
MLLVVICPVPYIRPEPALQPPTVTPARARINRPDVLGLDPEDANLRTTIVSSLGQIGTD